MSSRLKGVIAAIVTPVTSGGDPDPALFLEIAERHLAEGCDGLNVLGTTGEATSFSFNQRSGLMEKVAESKLAKDRLMVGTGAASTRDAAELTRLAAELGFSGALVLPPFYYKGVSDEGILRYFDAIVERSKGTDIPLYLYNFPALSGVAYTPGLVRTLLSAFGDRIAGLKDSSGDLSYAREVAALSDKLDVFPSNEAALAEARKGPFAGCISATANVNAAYCRKGLAGDDEALAKASLIRKLFDGKPLVPAVKRIVAHRMGIRSIADPLPPFTLFGGAAGDGLVAAYEEIVKA